MTRTDFIRVESACTCGKTVRIYGGQSRCAVCGELKAIKVERDPHPSADRIPTFGGALPWRDPERFAATLDKIVTKHAGAWGTLASTPTWPPLWAGVLLLCLLPLTGCQFIAYQHNDYRTNEPSPQPPALIAPAAPTFPGMLGISPGIEDIARIAGPGVVVAHSAGAARATRLIRSINQRSRYDRRDEEAGEPGGRPRAAILHLFAPPAASAGGVASIRGTGSAGCGVGFERGDDGRPAEAAGSQGRRRAQPAGEVMPRALLLIDPWPPNIEVPPGVPVVYVVSGRPGRVTVHPGTRLVELSHGGGLCLWAWTVGHVLACYWPESRDAASMAAAQARMASAGSAN